MFLVDTCGDILDFSKVKKPKLSTPIKLKKLSPDKIDIAKKKIRDIGEKLNAGQNNIGNEEANLLRYKDEAYYGVIEMLDGEELETGLAANAKIELEQ